MQADNDTTKNSKRIPKLSTHQFIYDGNTYETKAAVKGDSYEVRVFEGAVAANRAVYSVCLATRYDMARSGFDATQELSKMARDDFIRWNNLLKAQKPDIDND